MSKINTNQKTKEIINLEYQMEKLVKSQQYRQAAVIKKKINKLMEKVIQKNTRKANFKIRNLM